VAAAVVATVASGPAGAAALAAVAASAAEFIAVAAFVIASATESTILAFVNCIRLTIVTSTAASCAAFNAVATAVPAGVVGGALPLTAAAVAAADARTNPNGVRVYRGSSPFGSLGTTTA
jgi:hypothetical protein